MRFPEVNCGPRHHLFGVRTQTGGLAHEPFVERYRAVPHRIFPLLPLVAFAVATAAQHPQHSNALDVPAIDPGFLELHVRAQEKYYAGDLEGAAQILDSATPRYPLEIFFMLRGRVRFDRNNLDGAFADFTAAADYDKDDHSARAALGELELKRGDVSAALQHFDAAAKCLEQPQNSILIPQMYRGTPYEAPVVKMELARVLRGRAAAKTALGEADSAQAILAKAADLDPKTAADFAGRAWAKFADMNYQGALEDLNEAIKKDPTAARAFLRRAHVRARLNDFAGALADIDSALALAPDDAELQHARGLHRLSVGDYAGALKDFDAALGTGRMKTLYPRYPRVVAARLAKTPEENAELQNLVSRLDNGWQKTVGLFVTGKISEKEFLKASDHPYWEQKAKQVCQATYYVGMQRLLARDVEQARTLLQACVDTGMRDLAEHMLARAELARLR